MAIEGPLRELGIHDVFQLLDLSRKTGTLAVTSELRDNEGTVHFRNGRVVAAAGTVFFGLFRDVNDYRYVLVYAAFLFLPAAAVALLLPELPDGETIQ